MKSSSLRGSLETVDDELKKLSSEKSGLSDEEAGIRLKQYERMCGVD